MKQQIYGYKLYVIGEQEPRYLEYRHGMELSATLLSQSPPKFFYLDGDVIQTACIRDIQRETLRDTQVIKGITCELPTQRELSEEEERSRKRLEAIVGGKQIKKIQ